MQWFKDYLIDRYGHPLYRVPVSLPFSCPHRQRNHGRGCIFCAEDGARARHLRQHLDLPEQVREGIKYIHRRYGKQCGFIAYFQAFTSTNAQVEILRKRYTEVLEQADFPAVIVATRPDCLPKPVLDYLAELNEKYDFWVELGVQTAHDSTLELINRQHDFRTVQEAIAKLTDRGIRCALKGKGNRNYHTQFKPIIRMDFILAVE